MVAVVGRFGTIVLAAAGVLTAGALGASAVPGTVQAENLNAQAVLRDAAKGFIESASQDPLTQERIVVCLSRQSGVSDIFAGGGSYQAGSYDNIAAQGLDMRSLITNLNRAVENCRREIGVR